MKRSNPRNATDGVPRPLDEELIEQLDTLATQSLRRSLRAVTGLGRLVYGDARELINFAGNDYLGLAQHAHLKRAAMQAVESQGVGAGSSRLVVGHFDLHEQLEQRFAKFKHAEAALLFSTGYMANLAVLTALPTPNDLILIDKLTHASLIDAAQASAAKMRTFRHLDTDHLAQRLDRFEGEEREGRVFIVTDSVFSMDGDVADLPALCKLATRYDAVMMVDEAHATGVLGPSGEGLAAAQGVTDKIDITISTASKALGGLGGIVTGSRAVVETLVNRARSFIYTTAVPPAQVAAIGAALDVVRDEPQRRHRLSELAARCREELRGMGWPLPDHEQATPIIPLIVGESAEALRLGQHLEAQGLLAVAIRPPTVPKGGSRVRLSLRADLRDEDIDRLLAALQTFTR